MRETFFLLLLLLVGIFSKVDYRVEIRDEVGVSLACSEDQWKQCERQN